MSKDVPLLVPVGDDATDDVEEPVHGKSSVALATFNVMKDAFSVASLALPFAAWQAGVALTCSLIVLLGLISMYTAKSLVRSGKLLASKSLSYPEIGFHAFGAIGRNVVRTVSIVTCIGAAAGWFIVIGQCLHEAFPSVSYTAWVLLSLGAILPLNWLRHVHQLGYASFVSVLTYLCLLGLIGWIADNPQTVHAPSETVRLIGGGPSALIAFGTAKFVFAGHEVFPSIHDSLAQPQRYNFTMTLSFSIMILFNLSMATIGVLAFKSSINSNVLVNLTALSSVSTIIPILSQLLVATMLVFTCPIVLVASFENIEEYLQQAGLMHRLLLPNEPAFNVLGRIVVRTPVTMVSVVIALTLSHLGQVVSLVGAIGDSCLGMIFPAAFLLRACSHLSAGEKVLNYAIIAFGILGMAAGITNFVYYAST